MSAIRGIDVGPVSAWLQANIAGAAAPFTFDLIAGGRSNLTFRVTGSDGHSVVLRRPPEGQVLATAHDMGREHRIISALGPTSIPVATALGLCEDPTVNGAPFYVMGYADGHVLRDAATAEKVFTEEQRRIAGNDLIDVLADLHALDVDAVGLGGLAKKEDYIRRQLKRWYSQYTQSAELCGHRVPLVDEMHDFFAARVPEQGPAAIVHGDYRLDNTMFGDDAKVLAVLDWEICTLGDPLADMGLLMVYWAEQGDPNPALGITPTTVAGFPTRAELRTRYAERSGRNVDHLDFYIAFGYWKLACILEGVYSRYAAGVGGGDSGDYRALGQQVEVLATAAQAAASGL